MNGWGKEGICVGSVGEDVGCARKGCEGEMIFKDPS